MVQTRPQPPGGRQTARRREILLEASKCFRDKGFHATGMRDVAAGLGMTVGNLYYYFENKGALLRFCQLDALRRLRQVVAWSAQESRRADQRLFLLVAGHVVCLNEGGWGSLAHLEIPEKSSEENRELIDRRRDYEQALEAVVREGQEAGVFRESDARLAVMAILGACNWTVSWFNPEGSRSAASIGEAFAEQLVRGLLTPGTTFERPVCTWPDFGEDFHDDGDKDGRDA
jgi:TetR/AcrR family transcriptional regulator, cholesterol catabolism regulator